MEDLALEKSIMKGLKSKKERHAFISNVLSILLCHIYHSVLMRNFMTVIAIDNCSFREKENHNKKLGLVINKLPFFIGQI